MDKTCPCGKIFFVKPYLLHRKKYCCKVCFYKYHGRKSGLEYKLVKPNSGAFKKGNKPWNTGKEWSEEFKKHQAIIHKGKHSSPKTEFKKGDTVADKNVKWKGDEVGYFASHGWMIRNYGKAKKCENRIKKMFIFTCNKKSRSYDWAFINKEGYKRDREQYMELCHSCHIIYDRQK